MAELLTLEELRRRSTEMGVNSSQAASGVQKQLVLRLLAEGRTMAEAAAAVNRTVPCVSRWLRDPEMRQRLMELNALAFQEIDKQLQVRAESAMQKINQAAEEAVDKLIALMEGADSETIQMRCAQDILDRNQETSKIRRVDKRSVNVNIDSAWLAAAAAVEAEEGPTGGPTING